MRRNWWIERQEEQDGTLKFHSALGDLDAVRTSLDENGNGLTAVNEAFMCACRFEHLAVASVLLERSMALDAELGKNLDGSVGRQEAGLYGETAPAAPWHGTRWGPRTPMASTPRRRRAATLRTPHG